MASERGIFAEIELLLERPGGWEALLSSLSEHPEYSPRNLIALARFKTAFPEKGTFALLSVREASARGGRLLPGSAGCDLELPVMTRGVDGTLALRGDTATETVYPISSFDGLPLEPDLQRIVIDRESPRAMDAFLAATSDIDMESMGEVAAYALLERYGMASGIPEKTDAERLARELPALLASMRAASERVDARLREKALRGNEGGAARLAETGAEEPATVPMTTGRLKQMLRTRKDAASGQAHM